MEFELINPSDPYTFIAKDLETAALVVFLLSTAYGAKTEDGSEEVPIFIFGGAEEWYKDNFKRSVEKGIEAKKNDVQEALDSFMYGHFKDRHHYEAALNAIDDPEKKRKFIAEWEGERSSLNNIGEYAHNLAAALKRQLIEAKGAVVSPR